MAKPKPSRTKSLPSPADLRVKVDPKLVALWNQHRTALEKAKGAGAKAFDVLWEAVDAIVNHDPPLYVVGDYGSAREFFAKELHETERTAQRNIRVARFANAAQEEKYGVSVLDAALGYVEAKNGAPLHGRAPMDFDRLKIGGRALDKLTVKDIQAATAKLTGDAKKKPKSASYKALATELAAHAPLKEVEVHEHAGLFSFRNVPAGSLHHFGAAVSRAASRGEAAPVKGKR